jgi:uncharacterized repeat protein (TIGR04076 family)
MPFVVTKARRCPMAEAKNVNTGDTDADYRKAWANLGKIEITMVEKNGECKHNVGDTYLYESPYKRPANVCFALLHVLDLYTWRVTLDFPSWNCENRNVYKIHCPDGTGTVWEMRLIK